MKIKYYREIWEDEWSFMSFRKVVEVVLERKVKLGVKVVSEWGRGLGGSRSVARRWVGFKGSIVEVIGFGKFAREEFSMCGYVLIDYVLCC